MTDTNGDASHMDDAHARRERWQRKYGAPTAGAALAALVGIMYVGLIILMTVNRT